MPVSVMIVGISGLGKIAIVLVMISVWKISLYVDHRYCSSSDK